MKEFKLSVIEKITIVAHKGVSVARNLLFTAALLLGAYIVFIACNLKQDVSLITTLENLFGLVVIGFISHGLKVTLDVVATMIHNNCELASEDTAIEASEGKKREALIRKQSLMMNVRMISLARAWVTAYKTLLVGEFGLVLAGLFMIALQPIILPLLNGAAVGSSAHLFNISHLTLATMFFVCATGCFILCHVLKRDMDDAVAIAKNGPDEYEMEESEHLVFSEPRETRESDLVKTSD